MTYKRNYSLYGLKQSPVCRMKAEVHTGRYWLFETWIVRMNFYNERWSSWGCGIGLGWRPGHIWRRYRRDSLGKSKLQSLSKLKDLGELRHYLAVTIERQGNTLLLLQKAYCNRVLKLLERDRAKPGLTPMVEEIDGFSVSAPSDKAMRAKMIHIPSRQLVGSLLYLCSHTCSDPSFFVGILSRFVSDPMKVHWNAGRRILRDLVGT